MEYVDLGLPSGTKWAICNIGAAFPSHAGIDYLRDEATIVAKQQGGCLPTKTDLVELIDNCLWKEIDQNGMKGFCVIGRNGNSIYLSADHGDGDIWLSDIGSIGGEDEPYLAIYVDADKESSSWIPMGINEKCAVRLVLK